MEATTNTTEITLIVIPTGAAQYRWICIPIGQQKSEFAITSAEILQGRKPFRISLTEEDKEQTGIVPCSTVYIYRASQKYHF